MSSRSMAILSVLTLLTSGESLLAADSPGKLRSEMAKAEKDFVALYNKVNTNPEFAIVCRMDTPTGTSFAVRVCEPRYLITANARSASQRMQSAVAAGSATGSGNVNGPNVGAGVGADGAISVIDKDEAFRQNMLDLLQKNADLQTLGRKRDDLQTRFNESTGAKGSR